MSSKNFTHLFILFVKDCKFGEKKERKKENGEKRKNRKNSEKKIKEKVPLKHLVGGQ